ALTQSVTLARAHPGGQAEITELAGLGFQGVQFGHGVDEGEADPTADIAMRLHAGWDPGAHHFAAPPLHHEEVDAEDGRVVAEDVGPRRTVELSREPGENLVLASHVVRAGGELTHGRPTQHELVGAEA